MSLGLNDLGKRTPKRKKKTKEPLTPRMQPWAAGTLGFKQPKARKEFALNVESLDYEKPPFLWVHKWRDAQIDFLVGIEEKIESWALGSIERLRNFLGF